MDYNNSQIIINFPKPGIWTNFILTAMWEDGRWSRRKITRPEQVPAEHLAVLQHVIADLQSLGEPWTATHVVAHLETISPDPESTTQFEPFEVVQLTLYAQHDIDKATAMFNSTDFPALCVQGSDAVAAYKHFFLS